MSFLVLTLVALAVLWVLTALTQEIRTDGYGHREPPQSPSPFENPRLRWL